MKTLYIIGNGFDRFHDLLTRYKDFHLYILKNEVDLEQTLDLYFKFQYSDGFWTNFEDALGTFDPSAFYNNNNNFDINDDSFRPSTVFSIEDDITEMTKNFVADLKTALLYWIEGIEFTGVNPKLQFESSALFMSFNYTQLLEAVYGIEKHRVWHVHGSLESDELIIGHDVLIESELELDENGESKRTMFTDSIAASKYPLFAFYKPVNEIIENNQSYFDSLSDVSHIIVYGHSLNRIDLPYIKAIKDSTVDAKWTVSYHDENERLHHLDALQSIGVSDSKINLISSIGTYYNKEKNWR